MKIAISGYLTEQKLAEALKAIVGAQWGGSQLAVPSSRRRWDMWFQEEQGRVVVEFDGDEHYRSTLKIKVDIEKDAVAREHGIRSVRVPYWVQLDSVTLDHFFGIQADIEQDFQHGFIVTKVFPASFCEMGVERFRRELATLPASVHAAVLRSLRDRAQEHGVEYVLPSALRDLLAST